MNKEFNPFAGDITYTLTDVVTGEVVYKGKRLNIASDMSISGENPRKLVATDANGIEKDFDIA